jgi:molybdopterin molybdotransferase
VGMLAAVGRTTVLVHPRPRVVVLSTGDELQEPGEQLRHGAIRDANSYALTALAREAGATAFRTPIVPDDRRLLQEAFEGALTQADLLVTTGGVSAGRYDYVKQVLTTLGEVRFSKVGMQPGMPQAFGFLGTVPCFGLPGNPVSAYVSFEVFVRPALRRMQGRTDLNRPRVTAVLEDEVESPLNKVSFLRVKLRRSDGTWHATTTGNQSSGILRSVVEADGLAEIPPNRTSLFPGERIVVHLLVDTV